MSARSEPLLWVQLIGAGLLPLEGLLLLLLLAGSDPGPLPALERLLCWALGGLATTLLLWKRPADVWSLLLLQTPLRARRPLQQRLSRLQEGLLPRLGLVLGGALSLPMLWWLDEHAGAAGESALLVGSPRLVLLLLAALLLSLMLWQWQQLVQALWLLSRTPEAVAAARPMAQAELEQSRLCLGLPLLLLEPLQLAEDVSALRRAPSASPASPGTPAAGEGSAVAASPQASDGLAGDASSSGAPIPAPEPAASPSTSPAAADGVGEHPASAELLAPPQPAEDPVSADSMDEGDAEPPAGAEPPVSTPPSGTALPAPAPAQDTTEELPGSPSQSAEASEAGTADQVAPPAVSGASGEDAQPLEQPSDPGALSHQQDDQAAQSAETPQPLDLPQHPQMQEPVEPESLQALEPPASSQELSGSQASASQVVAADSPAALDDSAPDPAPASLDGVAAGGDPSGARVAVAVEPEQAAADQQGAHLDQQIR